MSITVEIRGEYIQLDQLLKTTGLCHSGGYAHAEIEAGNVLVDGAVETRKRAKLRPGQHIHRPRRNRPSQRKRGHRPNKIARHTPPPSQSR